MKKTIGGDRIGTGNKMTVELHNYGRSTHDIGYIWKSTMAAGTLVPFMNEVALPGTTFDINLDAYVMTHPTIGPLFGSYKMQLDIYHAPIRLYQGHLHNNQLGIGLNMKAIKLPEYTMVTLPYDPINNPEPAVLDNSQINPSCLLAYLGVRGVGYNNSNEQAIRAFNGVPLIAYWDVVKNYYANKQEEIGAVLHTPFPDIIRTIDTINIAGGSDLVQDPTPGSSPTDILDTQGKAMNLAWSGTEPVEEQIIFITTTGDYSWNQLAAATAKGSGTWVGSYDRSRWGELAVIGWRYLAINEIAATKPDILTFPLSNIDTMRERILAASTVDNTAFNINEQDLQPYGLVIGTNVDGRNYALGSQEGLALKTYQSDLFNNWIKTEWIDGPTGVSALSAVQVTDEGTFTMDQLNLAQKVYQMLNRIAISGGSYDDWQDAVYSHQRYTRCESPVYHGGLIKELIFQEVVSLSSAQEENGATQPLGTLAGKGLLAKKHKGGHVIINVDEPCYIMGIVSLTPRLDYSQGNKWDTQLKTMDDFHKPALDEIGFQESITEERAWWDTHWDNVNDVWLTRSAGKVPAWINYMTNVNQTYGNFAIQNNEMFMTLNRRYELDETTKQIKDLTTYVDPSKFNNIFAQTTLDAQNFWVQIAVDITARRKMSAKLMPNL